MSIILLHLQGSYKGRKDQFNQEVVRFGRQADNDVIFSESVVSNYHAEISTKGDSHHLVDLGSKNGTFLNGERVRMKALQDGDRVELGSNGPAFEFQLDPASQGDVPRIVPISGSWENPDAAIELRGKKIALGRGLKNDVVVGRASGSPVSSEHAEIRIQSDFCEIEDFRSTNGTFVNGQKIRTARLKQGDRVELGKGGPVFEFRWNEGQRAEKPKNASESEKMFRKLEHAARGGPAGERTRMFLQVADKYHKRRRWPLMALAVVVLLVAAGIAVALYEKDRQLKALTLQADEIFYQMRQVEAQLVRTGEAMSVEERQDLRQRKARFEKEYDRYLETLGVYTNRNPEEQAIMRLARRLGETDLEVPPDFHKTVLQYVERWRSTPRLRRALDSARQRSLPRRIRVALDQYGLPREFLFLALQESDFDNTRVGPPTSFGFAKGMWQFIPQTAIEYGLTPGPLKHLPQYDPSDQRHDENRATQAAARYLAFLYSTKAQASGLLVIASYNYGSTRIVQKLDQLPNDPRQRSFWNFYRNGWIPAETRDYVMYIFSAALICERPDLFNISVPPIDTMW